jgi:hypothetical protein
MDSAQSDASGSQTGIKLDTSLPESSAPSLSGSAGSADTNAPSSGGAAYYQPPSGQTSVDPVPATTSAVGSRSVMGEVSPAPGSPVLGSPAAPSSSNASRPSIPTMGMNSTAAAVTGAATPPSVSNDAMSNQVQQRMQAANTGAGAGKKRSLLLPILGVVFLLAVAAAGAFWWWNNQQTAEVELPMRNESIVQRESSPQDQPVVSEGVLPRTDSVNNDFADSEVTDETSSTGEVYGLICKYEETHPSGIVAFYEPESQTIHRMPILQDKNVYSMKVPAGSYLAFFEPTNEQLPIFAFTQYVNCGMNPNTCTDHSMALFTVEAGQEYGQVDLCDPQYVQDGLPVELQYENS